MAFQNIDNSFENEAQGAPVYIWVPLTGATLLMRQAFNNCTDVFINPAGTLAALTVKLPQVSAGKIIEFCSSQIITSMTFQDRLGNTVATAPTALAANVMVTLKYINGTLGWRKWY